jgi:hypothetical protein
MALHPIRILAVGALLVLLAVLGVSNSGAQPAPAALAAAQAPLQTPTPPACGPAWRVVTSPNPGQGPNLFGDVTALAPDDVWTVGYYAQNATSPARTLAAHWDGGAWSVVNSPNPDPQSNILLAVDALAGNDVWAVGNRGGGARITLVEHWDGTQWSWVPAPTPAIESHLRAVDAIAAGDVWAVGYQIISSGGVGLHQTLIEHWDGSQWSVIPSPNVGPTHNSLYAVAAVASNDVWAAGFYVHSVTGNQQTLLLHWDGSAWSVVPSPNPGNLNYLYGLTALSPTDVWAVGYRDQQTLTLHWDGTAWSHVPSPSPNQFNVLYGVGGSGPDDVWAVGYHCCNGNQGWSLLLHWDGAGWSVVPSPSPGVHANYLNGVAAIGPGDAWAVGNFSACSGCPSRTLALRYSDPCATPTPTVTGTPPTATPVVTRTRTPTSTLPPSGTPTATPQPCGPDSNFAVSTVVGATVVPGSTNIGLVCDDCTTTISLPFPVQLYDRTFSSANVSANGTLQFVSNNAAALNFCLPTAVMDYAIMPYWTDLTTFCGGCGVYTSVSGSPPDRIFNIEWRTEYFLGGTANFEVRLYENSPLQQFDVIYGPLGPGANDITVGVQKGQGSRYTQYVCNQGGLFQGLKLTFTLPACAATTPSATVATSTPTPTATPPATPSTTPAPTCGAQLVAPYPQPIADSAVAEANNMLYSFGGTSNGTVTANSYRYGWVALAPMPTPRRAAAAVAFNNKIYVAGGRGADGNAHAEVFVYDIPSNSWCWPSPCPSFQTATWGHALVVLNNTLYRIVGATGSNSYTNTVEGPGGYVAPYPEAAGYVQAVSYNGYIYVAGGYNGSVELAKTYRYDPATNTWDDQAVSDLPTGRYAGAPAIMNGKWVIAGGYAGAVASDTILSLDLSNPVGNWQIESVHLAAPRSNVGGAVVNGLMYLVGGLPLSGGNNGTTEVQRISLVSCASPTLTPTAAASTSTPVPTATATASPTVCPIQFQDVDQNNPFYGAIRCLACRSIISGYTTSPPCAPGQTPCFNWGAPVTRGQLAKILAGAARYTDPIPSSRQSFQDVPFGNPFWLWVEQLFQHGAISGYACGQDPTEPCVPPDNRPYFRWGANATRGQISKIAAIAAGYTDPIPTTEQTFEDVPASNPFWVWIEALAQRQIISGYTCGGPGEPCVPPGNRPYFRWGANATRGQMAKIAANTFYPACQPAGALPP